MGRNHARIYSEMPGVRLVGVADTVAETASAAGEKYRVPAYTSGESLLDAQRLDIVTIAVPTSGHLKMAGACIVRGVHVLVEKPIAFTLEEGRQMIDMARSHGVLLAVGHVERFNPAVVALKALLDAGSLGRIYQLDARRHGPFPARVQDVGVIVDLVVHDIDVMRYLTGANVQHAYAETARRVHSAQEDMFCGLVRFVDGCVGTLSVNWLTPAKVRDMTVTGEHGVYRVDYLNQELVFFGNDAANRPDWDPLALPRGVSEGRMLRHALNKREPLAAELETFVAAVRGAPNAIVSGEDGLAALQAAQAFVQSGELGIPIRLNPRQQRVAAPEGMQ